MGNLKIGKHPKLCQIQLKIISYYFSQEEGRVRVILVQYELNLPNGFANEDCFSYKCMCSTCGFSNAELNIPPCMV